MREIKFRAWFDVDDLRKGMYYFGLDDFDSDDGSQWINSNNGDSMFSYSDMINSPIMQFTGLKDKNGKEIYEGDIVEHNTISGKWLGVVEYKKWCFTQLTDENIEVIGNIYENPELLSQNQLNKK